MLRFGAMQPEFRPSGASGRGPLPPPRKILVVDDSRFLLSVFKRQLENRLGLTVLPALNHQEAVDLVRRERHEIFLSVLDLNLPDADRGALVDHVRACGIPVIVFTGELADDVRDSILSKHVIDYIAKENPYNIEYAIGLIARIYRNQEVGVLVVDDSYTQRRNIAELLHAHRYQVVEAIDGFDALEKLEQHRSIRLVLTDYRMPRMDGFQLTSRIRRRYSREQLAIIGISAYGNQMLSARFLKNGANDFINKPFLAEEFHSRVRQNVEMIEQFEALREASIRDFLTGLFNRKYLFETGRKLHASALRGQNRLTLAMVDIDHFKSINDRFGHDAGDQVLIAVAARLNATFREQDVVARLGGEEFCVLALNMDPARLETIFERCRQTIAATPVHAGEMAVPVTVSIGVCDAVGDSFESMLKQADTLLYRAKAEGRNRLCVGSPDATARPPDRDPALLSSPHARVDQ